MLDLAEDYMRILGNIDGFLVIDKDEKIVYMADNLIRQMHMEKPEDVIGENIRDLIPTNNTYKILQTGEKQIGEMYFIDGYTIISNGYPIYKDGELIGAFEYDIFSNIGFLEEFMEKVNTVGDGKVNIHRKKHHASKKAKYSLDDMKGSGPAMTKLKSEVTAAAKSQSTVLITGETGCGKELVAHAIHKLSQRSLFHFVRVNCAAIPAELFESELFGYDEGSFTGARKGGKFGMAEIASNGTLFLDEIDNLTLHMQAKILRFLQEKEIYHVGGDFAIPVNTRVVAATNQDPRKLVEAGKMRKDFYYRLNVIEIHVPPLRERKEDIPEIAQSLVEGFNTTFEAVGIRVESIDPEVYRLLAAYDWPGNIRELSNVLERAFNRCEGKRMKPEHFDDFAKDLDLRAQKEEPLLFDENATLKEIKDQAEEYAIRRALLHNGQNITKAASALGISRQILHRKLKARKEKRKQKVTVWHRT